MNILMVSSEAAPFIRCSNVANVVAELSLQLRRNDHDVRLIIPNYRNISIDSQPCVLINRMEIPLGVFSQFAEIKKFEYQIDSSLNLPVYLVDNPFYFGRENQFGYLDDAERFIFFTRAIMEMLVNPTFADESWKPDVIHGHDWIAGLIPFWLRQNYKDISGLSSVACAYTLHNTNFLGTFGTRSLSLAEISDLGLYEELHEIAAKRINFMARGTMAADVVNTVSPQHALEIKKQGFVPSLAAVSTARQPELSGILNGIDYSLYNPAFDKCLAANFDSFEIKKRELNKLSLQEECSFRKELKIPMLGMVGRLTYKKGVSLLTKILPDLLEADDVQCVVLGEIDDYRNRELFNEFTKKYRDRFVTYLKFDDPLARKIFAGVDIYLMPSLHEPCGLQHMIAMRYGAIPLVRKTGGLVDTIESWEEPQSEIGQGFVFDSYKSAELLGAVRSAVKLYRSDNKKWMDIQRHNLGLNYSWENPSRQYEELYEQAIQNLPRRLQLIKGNPIELERSDLLIQAILKTNELSTTDDQGGCLKQIARSARKLLNSDAALIWLNDESQPEQLKLAAHSLAKDAEYRQAEDTIQHEDWFVYSDHGNRAVKYIYQLANDDSSSPHEKGFLDSDLAREYGWAIQLSIPISSHGTFLGKIDAFSCNSDHVFKGQDINSLGTLCNTIAVNIEKNRMEQQTDKLLSIDREMALTESVDEVARIVLEHAKNLTRAAKGTLYIENDLIYILDENDQFNTNTIPEGLIRIPKNVGELTCEYFHQLDNQRHDLTATSDQIKDDGAESDNLLSVLENSDQNPFGIIRLGHPAHQKFSLEDQLVLDHLAGQAATGIQAARQRDFRDKERVNQLSKLSSSLIGGIGLSGLCEKVVESTADVLKTQAASLYLYNYDTDMLEIRAATGYHKPLLDKKASYKIGEGTTGKIAEKGEMFRANSLKELHAYSSWKGKHLHLQKGKEPNAFLGVPIKVKDRKTDQEKVIGVLKLEDRQEEQTEQTVFTDEDVLLVDMMANVIATVIENSRLSDERLRELSRNLEKLSRALVGGLEMSVLVKEVVDTIAKVSKAQAASLYLYNYDTDMLEIRAATGYHKPLLDKKASYKIGEGTTGKIAEKGEMFRANSLKELHAYSSWKGKHLHLQKGKEPNAFLGVPIKVKDRKTDQEKVIGVLKLEDRQEEQTEQTVFTDEDVLLVDMMANVIATVIENSRLSDERLRELSRNLEKLSRALVGGLEMSVLVKEVVDTIAKVSKAQAASLYLYNYDTDMLEIRAATGYHKPLLDKKASYKIGEGTTGKIAEIGEMFRANSLKELHAYSSWKGKHLHLQKGKEPNAFLGVPIKVKDRKTDQEKVIGVLKLEDRQEEQTEQTVFTDEDVLLVDMMANVIATVIQNSHLSDLRIKQIKDNLHTLSLSLLHIHNLPKLVQKIVFTIANMLRIETLSLFVFDPDTQKHIAWYTTGQQRQHEEKEDGLNLHSVEVARRICGEAKTVNLRTTEDIQTYFKLIPVDKNQFKSKSFMGIPLKTKINGFDKIVGALLCEISRPIVDGGESFFSEQDQFFSEILSTLIVPIIENTRFNESRVEELLTRIISDAIPLKSDSELFNILGTYVQAEDRAALKAYSALLLNYLQDKDGQALAQQTEMLINMQPNPDVYEILAQTCGDEWVKKWFMSLFKLSQDNETNMQEVMHALELLEISRLMINVSGDEEVNQLHKAIDSSAEKVADSLKGHARYSLAKGKWIVLEFTGIFPETTKVATPENLPFIFFLGTDLLSDDDVNQLTQILKNLATKTSAVVHFLGDELKTKFTDKLRQQFKSLAVDFLFFNLWDLQRLVCCNQPREMMLEFFLRGVRLKTVSPYTRRGKVTGNMFFGRERELRNITENVKKRSYVIIGGRRLGKTSILRQLHEYRLPEAGYRSIYHSFDYLGPGDFLEMTIQDWGKYKPSSPPKNFGELLKSVPRDMPLVVLLDETDELIEQDQRNGWKLLKLLRGFVNADQLKLVMTGERTLKMVLHDSSGPLFNLAEEILLTPLNNEDVKELIIQPMRELKIPLENEEEIIGRIIAFSSRHPNVVQCLCDRLIKRMDEPGIRLVKMEDVNAVINNTEFIRDDFLDTFLAKATVLEHLCALIMGRDLKLDTPNIIFNAIEDIGISPKENQILAALKRLVELRCVLTKKEETYEFAVSEFPKIISANDNRLDRWIKIRCHFFKNCGDKQPDTRQDDCPEAEGTENVLWD